MKRRRSSLAVAAVLTTGLFAFAAAGVASGASSGSAARQTVAVKLSVAGAGTSPAQEQPGQAAKLVASAPKLPRGDTLLIEGRKQGQAKWFKVAQCSSAHCSGTHSEPAPARDVFEAFAVRKGSLTAVDGHSKPVPVVWKAAPLPTISIADVATGQTYTAATTTLSFPVTLSAPSKKDVTIAYATADGGAKAGNDYTAASGTLDFAPGVTSKTVDVTITADKALHGDDAGESAETFTVTLSTPVNATVARASATGTIANDDPPTPMPGHYVGTTSQGYAVTFDVAPDDSSLTGANLTIDADCGQFGVIQFSGDWGQSIALNQSDWSFSDAQGADYADGTSIRVYFRGNVTLDGKAQGSLEASVIFQAYGVTCDSGAITFNAAHS